MPVTIFHVEVADQVYTKTHHIVYLGENVNHDADLSVEVDRRLRNAWCSFRTVRLTQISPSGSRSGCESRSTRDKALYVCVTSKRCAEPITAS